MELKDQVVSLELAKKLKELGVKQESYFVWVEAAGNVQLWSADKVELVDGANKEIIMASRKYTSAFTVAELGEMFGGKNFAVGIDPNEYWCEWYAKFGPIKQSDPVSLANAAAKMLINLLENGLLPTDK